jgi:trimeric autotransporter adhesin
LFHFVRLTATGTFSEGTTEDLAGQAHWTSNPVSTAVVFNGQVNGGQLIGLNVGSAGTKGLVTGVNLGPTTILTTLGGIQGSASVAVSAAILQTITVGPPNPSIAKGTTLQLTATGNFSDGTTKDFTSLASWSSADNTIAVVSNGSVSQGLVTGQSVGSTAITATLAGI